MDTMDVTAELAPPGQRSALKRLLGLVIAGLLLAGVVGVAVHAGPAGTRLGVGRPAPVALAHAADALSTHTVEIHFQADVSSSSSPLVQHMTGDGVIDGLHHTLNLVLQAGKITFEERIVNGVVYVRNGGPTWRSTPLPAGLKDHPPASFDAAGVIAALNKLSPQLRPVGVIDDAGTTVTRYQGNVPLSKLSPPSQPSTPTEAGVVVPLTIDVDADGRLHRIIEDLAALLPAQPGTHLPILTIDMTFDHYGVAVHVTAPTGTVIPVPASQTGAVLTFPSTPSS